MMPVPHWCASYCSSSYLTKLSYEFIIKLQLKYCRYIYVYSHTVIKCIKGLYTNCLFSNSAHQRLQVYPLFTICIYDFHVNFVSQLHKYR